MWLCRFLGVISGVAPSYSTAFLMKGRGMDVSGDSYPGKAFVGDVPYSTYHSTPRIISPRRSVGKIEGNFLMPTSLSVPSLLTQSTVLVASTQ